MEHSPSVIIEIVEIEPVAVYKDTVYDQTIISRLEDGTEIKIFDPAPMTVENDKIGDVMDIAISVLSKSGVKKATDENIGVYPAANPSSEWSYDFVGDIIDIDLDGHSILLDIGCGIISYGFNEEVRELVSSNRVTPGDRLYAPASRTDLVEIN